MSTVPVHGREPEKVTDTGCLANKHHEMGKKMSLFVIVRDLVIMYFFRPRQPITASSEACHGPETAADKDLASVAE